MLIIDALRNAGTAQEVCYLLTNYVETLQFYDAAGRLPTGFTVLPVRGLDDIAARHAGLQAARSNDAKRMGVLGGGAILDEAINLFGEALLRLKALDQANAAHFIFERRTNGRSNAGTLRA